MPYGRLTMSNKLPEKQVFFNYYLIQYPVLNVSYTSVKARYKHQNHT